MSNATTLTARPSHTPTHSHGPVNDRRSSSLSELAELAGNDAFESIDHENNNVQDANDTEAETERIEDSPFKRRKHQNVVLTPGDANATFPKRLSLDTIQDAQSRPISEGSSSVGSSGDEMQGVSAAYSPRKRKRSSLDGVNEIGAGLTTSPLAPKSPSSDSVSPKSAHDIRLASEEDEVPTRDPSESDAADLAQQTNDEPKLKSGKRKGKKMMGEHTRLHHDIVDGRDANVDLGDSGEAADSNGDDVEGDDAGDAELENPNKSHEELAKKKSALDSLTALEKCFATMRDRLFDERLAAANEELTLLQTPDFVHPELLAMKEAIDRHQQQKIKYQQTFLKYKLETLQRESVATKHQAQSQYMQTVREVRDKSLDQLNKEFYQVQRERRSGDGDVPESMYLYSNNRLQQITQQTAYNSEVSILSGVAKYVGFPAAPAIKRARPNELDDDMKSMGIAPPPVPSLQNKFPSLRANISAAASVNRRTPTAEEDFLGRNAWANPQHPAHQRMQIQRQVSQLSQPSNQTSTPMPQKVAEPIGSGSTVLEQQLINVPSKEPTPVTTNYARTSRGSPFNLASGKRTEHDTPSKAPSALSESMATRTETRDSRPSQAQLLATNSPARHHSPSAIHGDTTRDGHNPNGLPRPLPFSQNIGSPPVRLPEKIEDTQASRQSPAPHQFSSPAPIITAGNGQLR